MRTFHLELLAAAALLAGAPCAAQTSAEPAAPAAPVVAAAVDPSATEALQRMGRHLQSLQAFSVKARTSTDQVLASGQKVQLDAGLTMWVRRPNLLRIDLSSDRRSRQFFFDGKNVTVYGKASGYYGKFPAPSTLGELLGKLSDEYNLELPLADLFTWGDSAAVAPQFTSAAAIGLATVRGTACDQYAFRQDGLDWQVWIQRGAQPLPRRLVLTTTTDPAQPQYTMELDWSPNDKAAASVFAFQPPAGSHEIPVRRADGTVTPKR